MSYQLRRSTHLGYALGSVGTGIFTTVPGLLLITFMVRQLEVPAALAGAVVLVPRLWDVVTDPIIGSLSDRTRTRIGPRRPWMLAGGILAPVVFAVLFTSTDLSGTAAAAWVLVTYLVATTTFTMFQIPYIALPAEITSDYDERTTIVAWRIAALAVGILVSGAGAPLIIDFGGGGRDGFALMGIVIGAVACAVFLGSTFGIRRAPVVEPVRSTMPLREQLRAAADNRPFFWLLGCFIVQALGIGAMLAGVEFFAAYILGDPALTTILFVLLIGPALLLMPVWARVGHRAGKRVGYAACTVLFASGALGLLLLVSAERTWPAYLLVLLMGTGYAGTQMFPFAMLPDTITADTLRTGLRRAGAFTGLWSAGEKGGFAVGPTLFAWVLAAGGFIETEGGAIIDQPDAAITALVWGFAGVPALLMLASLALLWRYRLDETTARAIGAEQAAEAAAQADPSDEDPAGPNG